jgi:hypothetical protein
MYVSKFACLYILPVDLFGNGMCVSGGFIADIGLRTDVPFLKVKKDGTKIDYTCSSHTAARLENLSASVLWRVQM